MSLPPEYDRTVFLLEDAPDPPPRAFGIVTAWHPCGKPADAAANHLADRLFRHDLEAARVPHFRVTGASPDLRHAEPGWAVGLGKAGALGEARRLRQLALWWVEEDRLWLIDAADGREREIGGFTGRVRASYRVTAAAEADRPGIFSLQEQLFRAAIEGVWGWDADDQRARFAEEWSQSETALLHCGGEMAGYVQTQRRADPEHLYLLSLALLPPWQGRGLGTAVMLSLRQRAADLDLPLRLNVFRSNPRARAFYERLGFRELKPTESGHVLEWSAARGGE